MRRLPPRFTVRQMMVWVAVSAYASAVGVPLLRACLTHQRDMVLAACGLNVAVGLAAMRRPWIVVFPVFLFSMIAFAKGIVYHEISDGLIPGNCLPGWLIGAVGGWVSRGLARRDEKRAQALRDGTATAGEAVVTEEFSDSAPD